MSDFIFGSDEDKVKVRANTNPFKTTILHRAVGTVMQILTPDYYSYETISYRLEPGVTFLQFKVKGCSDVHLGIKGSFFINI